MDGAMEQAIDWMVKLDSDRATDKDRQLFSLWLAQEAAHERAWAIVQGHVNGLNPAIDRLRDAGMAAKAGVQALAAPVPSASRRRALQGGVAALLVSATAGWLVSRQVPLRSLVADLRTGTGERRRERLADGSEITLDARSAADILYGDSHRLVWLRQGALIADVAASADRSGAPRPFVVRSAEGMVEALGTRFMVRQENGRTLVHVMAHSVRLTTLSGTQRILQEGDTAYVGNTDITPADASLMAPAAWGEGLVQVRDQPLGAVVDALRPYTAGLIRVSPEAARLRVFGVFPLDRPEQVLQDLVDTQPVSVTHWSPWLTLVDLRAPAS